MVTKTLAQTNSGSLGPNLTFVGLNMHATNRPHARRSRYMCECWLTLWRYPSVGLSQLTYQSFQAQVVVTSLIRVGNVTFTQTTTDVQACSLGSVGTRVFFSSQSCDIRTIAKFGYRSGRKVETMYLPHVSGLQWVTTYFLKPHYIIATCVWFIVGCDIFLKPRYIIATCVWFIVGCDIFLKPRYIFGP